jgi:hypothetical protein
MGRPKNKHPSTEVPITATPKLVAYLNALVDEEGYGTSRAEVARTLVWRGVEDLIKGRILEQIRGPVRPAKHRPRKQPAQGREV